MNVLGLANKKAHEQRPYTPKGKILTLWQPSEHFIHCCITSQGCHFSRENGACLMCDYGVGHNISPGELQCALDDLLLPLLPDITTILLGSYGSILDESEISSSCLDIILAFLRDHPVPNVIFETHCNTVTEKNLQRVKSGLPRNIETTIEMGYESCDAYVLKYCLNKVLDLDKLKDSIALCHHYSMKVCLNVFVGAPFLSASDQLGTALESILWAIEQNADSVVLFPCNIKPFTLLYKLYKNDQYTPVSHWMLLELLRLLPASILAKITFSWYGDRKNFYENNAFALIPPSDCEKCHEAIFSFYKNFMDEPSSTGRRRLLDNILSADTGCNCHAEFTASVASGENARFTQDQNRLAPWEIESIVQKYI